MMETSLHVRRVGKRHFANYLCQAKNSLGEDQLVLSLAEATAVERSSAQRSAAGSILTAVLLMASRLWT
jgi:hypothetical protein